MAKPPTPLLRNKLNAVTKTNSEISGMGPAMGSDTQAVNAAEISHVEQSFVPKALQPTPLPRSKSNVEPSKKLAQLRSCQDQQNADQVFEEEAEKKPCTPLLPSPRLLQTPISHFSDSAPPLPPLVGPSCSASEKEQVPIYLEILPEETTPTEVSHMERSSSLVMHKSGQPTPVHRSKSHAEPLFRKLALSRMSQDLQKANQGVKKPLGTGYRSPRPERPPPPNITKNHGSHRPPLSRQMEFWSSSGGCDTQDGDSKTSMKISEEETEKKSHTPLLQSPRLPQTSSSHSLASDPPLSPPIGPSCSVSEQEQVPIYLEILPEEMSNTEVSLERSSSLPALKPEPRTPVQRSKSNIELLSQKLALSRNGQDQQKENQGAKKPLGNVYRSLRPERPPPPNITKNRGGYSPPLPIQMPRQRPLDGCDTQDRNSKTPPVDCDSHYEDSKTPPVGCDSHYEDSKTPTVGCDSHYEDSTFPPVGCDSHEEDNKTPTVGCDSHYEDSKFPPVGCDSYYEDNKSPPVGCDSHEEDNKTPPVGCDSHEEDSKTLPVGCDSHKDDSKTPPVGCDSQYEDSKPPTPLLPSLRLPETSSSHSSDSAPPLSPLIGPSCSVLEQEQVPLYLEILPEEASITEVSLERSSSLPALKPEPRTPVQRSKSNIELLSQKLALSRNGQDQQKENQGAKKPLGTGYRRPRPERPPPPNFTKPCTPLLPCPRFAPDAEETTTEVSHLERRPSLPSHKPEPPSTPVQRSKSNVELLSQKPSSSQNSQDQQKENQGLKKPLGTGYRRPRPERPPPPNFTKPCTSLLPCPRFAPDAEETTTEAPRSKAVHDFFCKRPLPPIPHHKSHEPLYEELGSYPSIKNDYSEEHKPEDIEVLMAWWHTVGQRDNMPLDYEITEEEEMRVFDIMAYRIKMGLSLYSCLLSKNGESLQNSITELNTTADNLDKKRKKVKIAAMAGGATGAVGGVAVVAGLVLAPLTLGASLAVTAVGVGVATVGGVTGASAALTNKVNSNLDRKKVEKIVLDYRDEVSDIERCLQFVSMGMGWLGEQDACRLSAADGETAAVARLAEVVRSDGGSLQTACQSLEILQNFCLAMDDFFTNDETQKVKKGTETKFADKIRSLAEQLQEGLNSLMKIREILNKAASTTGVYEEDSYCS